MKALWIIQKTMSAGGTIFVLGSKNNEAIPPKYNTG